MTVSLGKLDRMLKEEVEKINNKTKGERGGNHLGCKSALRGARRVLSPSEVLWMEHVSGGSGGTGGQSRKV